MNTRKMRMAALVLAIGMSGTAQAALHGRDLNGSIDSFEAYYDTDLDITWLTDANYAKTSGYHADGLMDWSEANTWAANLSFYDAVSNISYDNWRLPTVEPVNGTSFNYNASFNGTTDAGYNITSPQSEMAYMFYVNLGNPGFSTAEGTLSGCSAYSAITCLQNVGPFSNLQDDVHAYWSATEYAWNPTDAWYFTMYAGSQYAEPKYYGDYAWAVSPGDVGIAAIPEPETYAMMLVGLGLVGAVARRRWQSEA